MRVFTLDQYKALARNFNKMPFIKKIETLQNNKDILILACDGNCWGVKAVDKEIQNELYESEAGFHITNEWQFREMFDLVTLLGLEGVDI